MMQTKIVYIAPYFWPESIGSAPYCTDLCAWLRAKGHSVEVIAFRPHYPNPDLFAAWSDGSRDREVRDGLVIQRIKTRGRGSGGLRQRLLNDLAFLAGVLRYSVRPALSKPDVIAVNVPSCLSLFGAALLSWRTGARVVGIVHDIESGLAASLSIARRGLMLRLMRLIEYLAFNCASELIVLTDGMAAEIRDIGYRRPITVLPIWSSLFPEKARSATAAPVPVVSYSGNFGKKQNLDQLLPLIRMLDERRPEVKVILRGDGSERARIEALVKQLGVTNTSFLPLVAADELGEWLQSVDIHLIPQAMNVANYALPSKLFTVMAAGGPFVCVAEQGSPLDQLSHNSGAGLCVRPNDDEALFSAVIQMLDNREMLAEMGQRGRSFVRANMDRDKILKSYEERMFGSRHGRVAGEQPSLSTV